MKREGLHRILSTIIREQLRGIAWTTSNCMKYLTADVLAHYRIRRATTVTITDWNKALDLAKEQHRHAQKQRTSALPDYTCKFTHLSDQAADTELHSSDPSASDGT
jgi:hypothetical protein